MNNDYRTGPAQPDAQHTDGQGREEGAPSGGRTAFRGAPPRRAWRTEGTWDGAAPAEIAEAARRRFGEPNRRLSRHGRLRFGRNGSVAVETEGEKAGQWYDHERRVGGVLERIGSGSGGPRTSRSAGAPPRDLAAGDSGRQAPERGDAARATGGGANGPATGEHGAGATGGGTDEQPAEGGEEAAAAGQSSSAFVLEQFAATAPLSPSDPAGRYLASRLLGDFARQDDLRYGASVRCKPDGKAGRALVGVVRDAGGEVVALHLIFLSLRGEALRRGDGKRLKLSCGPVSAGFLRLGPAHAKVFAVAEGPESAMSRLAAGPAALRACLGPLRYCEPPRGTERVEILADADKLREARALAQRYEREGFSAFVVEVPEDLGPKADLNDLLARDGPEGVRAAVEAAPRFRVGERFQHELDVGSDVEIAQRALETLEVLRGPVVCDEGRVWRYHARRWEPVADADLTRFVQRWDGAAYREGERERRVRLNRARIASVVANMAALRDEPGWFHAAPRGLACDNGFVRLDGAGEPHLEAHRRGHRVRHLVPGRWPAGDPERCAQGSLLQTLLLGCFGGDPDAREKALLMGELAGAALFGLGTRIRAPKAAVLVGETAENGKSQFLDVLEGLVPPGAACSIPPGKLCDERYVPTLAGKLLNVAAELSSRAIASDAFKAVVTGDLVSGREAYGRAASFRPEAQHVFATNVLPAFQGGVDAGVLRRLLVLEFGRTIPAAERVVDIGRRVAEEERDLLLELAVRGAGRLLRRQGFTVPPSSVLALRRWVAGVDPVRGWLDGAVRMVPAGRATPWPVSAAYDHFTAWAGGAGHQRAILPPLNGFVMRAKSAGAGAEHRHGHKGGTFLNLEPAPDAPPDASGPHGEPPAPEPRRSAPDGAEDDPLVAALLAPPSSGKIGGPSRQAVSSGPPRVAAPAADHPSVRPRATGMPNGAGESQDEAPPRPSAPGRPDDEFAPAAATGPGRPATPRHGADGLTACPPQLSELRGGNAEAEPPAAAPKGDHGAPVAPTGRPGASGGWRAAGLQRPPAWPGPAAPPPPGAWCSCCGRKGRSGGRWWRERRDPRGWRCWTCHPPDGLAPDQVEDLRT